jgi:tRNA pseudouridine55 synthase
LAPLPAPLEGVLLLDKPAGITSTRALATAKRLLQLRKAGHTGTLDPFATGLLPLVFGEATKFSRFLLDAVKSYEATLRLGEVTPSGDVETAVTERRAVAVDDRLIDEVLASFVGVQRQVPPMHSAVRIDGRRLYEHAREGVEIDRPARTIEVHEVKPLAREGNDLRIAVTCSKGTYVRTLGEDIGRTLGCGAHLVALRRTAIGSLDVRMAVKISEMEANSVDWSRGQLRPVELLVAALPRWDVTRESAVRFAQGQELPEAPGEAGGEVAVFAPGGRLVGVGVRAASGRLAPRRLMAVANPKAPDFS